MPDWLPGRTVHPGDSATANNRAPNPGDYYQIQQYTIYAGRNKTSLVLDPAGRINGKLWLDHNLRLFHDPHWNSSIRHVMLESIGAQYATGSGLRHPHPVAGTVTFYYYPSGGAQYDLNQLMVAWKDTDIVLEYSAISSSDWSRYRLYEGGFEYGAVEVSSVLSNVMLGPRPDNPLAIFYRRGLIILNDDVTISGTLVSTDQVTLAGDDIRISGFNWRGVEGRATVANINNWPRLSAVVADSLEMNRDVQAVVGGAVVVRSGW